MSLRARATLIVAALLTCTVIVLTIVLTLASARSLLNQAASDGETFARTFGQGLAEREQALERLGIPPATVDLGILLDQLVDEDYTAIWIVNADGSVRNRKTAPGMDLPAQPSADDQARLQTVIAQRRPASYADWGRVGVLAPVQHQDGQVTGAILVYISPRRVQEAITRQLAIALVAGIVIPLVGMGVSLAASRRLLRPIDQVRRAALAVEAGTFDPASLDEVTTRSDEVGHLARVFQQMARAVQVREAHLQQQVQEMRIEINAAKQAREVTQITNSDYFRDLQAKAQRLREPRPPAEAAEPGSASPA